MEDHNRAWTRKRKGRLILSLLILMSMLLAACSGNGNGNGNGDTAANTNEPAESTAETAENTETEEEPANTAPAERRTIDIVTSHIGLPYAMQANSETDPYIQKLSEISGYDLNFEILGHAADYTQQLTVMLASGELPDLLRTDRITSSTHAGAVEQGAFLDLTDLIEEHAPNMKAKISEETWNSTKVSKDGRIYGIPALTSLPVAWVYYIRQDWLDKLNMEVPDTIDEFVAYFEAVKVNDMNGNGDPNDEYGLYARENLGFSDVFFREFGVLPNMWEEVDGQLIPGIIRPEMKEALKFWRMMYENGYVNPDLFTTKGADWGAAILAGKAGFWKHSVLNYPGWTTGYAEPGAKVTMLGTATDGAARGIQDANDQVSYVWVIPSDTENPEEIIKFLDWAWSDDEEKDKFFAYGIEGTNYTVEGSEVKWDPEAPENATDQVIQFYQVVLNPAGDGRMDELVLDRLPYGEEMQKGIEIAMDNMIPNPAMNMPSPLEAFQTNPELVPGTGGGTLFLEMFAKVVTGQAEVDPAFDEFVAEWKSRGGDKAIQEANEWYQNNK